jgi:hypothetical protein
MRQRLWNGLTLLSAVICLGSLLWVGRSVVLCDWVDVPLGQSCSVVARSIDAQLWLGYAPFPVDLNYGSDSAADARPAFATVRQDLSGLPWLGIGWRIDGPWKYLVLPLWLLPLVTAILPVRWFLRRRRPGEGRGFEVLPPAGRESAGGGQ